MHVDMSGGNRQLVQEEEEQKPVNQRDSSLTMDQHTTSRYR
jgi:hypothetical protein